MDEEFLGENEALIKVMERLAVTEVVTPPALERGAMPLPSLVSVPDGRKLVSLKPYFDELSDRPERRKGVANFTTLESFIGHACRFKDEDSAIFAHQNADAPKLVSVLDYHHAGGESLPRFGGHRGVYDFPLSQEWIAWKKCHATMFNQQDFAAFLEERIADVADPAGAGDSVKEFVALLGTSLASPSRLMELSRGLTVHIGGKAVNAVNLSSGEGQITFTEEHKDATGAKLSVPGAFVLGIPVFRGGALYQVPARLRYRVQGESKAILWSYFLYRMDAVFQHAFDEAAFKAAEDTGLPVFYGTAE